MASNETGKNLEALPPGKIFGMTVTEPCSAPKPPSSPLAQNSQFSSSTPQNQQTIPTSKELEKLSLSPQKTVSQSAIDMLAQLFPHRKRSVLELVLRRCDLDLLRAIEQCSGGTNIGSAFRPPVSNSQV